MAEQALDHAHLGVEIVDLRDEHGFGCGGDDGGAPFEFALVAEHDVFEALEQVGIELRLDAGLADELVAEDDVALQDAPAALRRDKFALVFDDLAGVVHEHAREREVGVDLRVKRQQRARGAGHVHGVFEQAVAVGVVHRHGGRRHAELLADVVEEGLHRGAQLGVPDGGDVLVEFGPQRVGILRCRFHQIGQQRRTRQLVECDGLGAQELGREAVLVVVDLRLEADDAALLHGIDDIVGRAVAEDVQAEGAGLVAELHVEEGIAVLGDLAGDAFDQHDAGESIAAIARQGLDLTDGIRGREIGHGGTRPVSREGEDLATQMA